MQVVWGVGVLVVITALAKFFELTTTVWLMQQFWLVGIFLMIVIFQQEIRAGLAKLGSNPLPFGKLVMTSQEFTFIPEMMEAVKIASESKIGMLIVLEQDIGLMDVMRSGVWVNGRVSKELLLTIFFDKTLLHDGAVIIGNNSLISAGAILPLTEQQDLSKILGMRHRAALGLSECSDALIIVVSEENGHVSLARNGRLQQVVNLKDLEERLYDLYRSRAERSLLRKPKTPAPSGEGEKKEEERRDIA